MSLLAAYAEQSYGPYMSSDEHTADRGVAAAPAVGVDDLPRPPPRRINGFREGDDPDNFDFYYNPDDDDPDPNEDTRRYTARDIAVNGILPTASGALLYLDDYLRSKRNSSSDDEPEEEEQRRPAAAAAAASTTNPDAAYIDAFIRYIKAHQPPANARRKKLDVYFRGKLVKSNPPTVRIRYNKNTESCQRVLVDLDDVHDLFRYDFMLWRDRECIDPDTILRAYGLLPAGVTRNDICQEDNRLLQHDGSKKTACQSRKRADQRHVL